MDRMKLWIGALIAGLIVGYVAGANPDPLAVVTDPIGAIQNALDTL